MSRGDAVFCQCRKLSTELPSSSAMWLKHRAYIDTLPNPQKLLTGMHFNSSEYELFRGSRATNLYRSIQLRRFDWESDFQISKNFITSVAPDYGEAFTWSVKT